MGIEISPETGQLAPETTALVTRAEEVDGEVTNILSWIDESLDTAGHKRARLGLLLLEVSQSELFRPLGFASFNGWLKDRVEKFPNLKRSQLYVHMGVAKYLLPHIDPGKLERMGISKAKEISDMIRLTGKYPDADIIEAAENRFTTIEQLRAMLHERYALPAEEKPEGEYYDFGGFYAEPEEIEELNRALDVAARTDPAIGKGVPDPMRKKECLIRFAREYLATYEATVNAGRD